MEKLIFKRMIITVFSIALLASALGGCGNSSGSNSDGLVKLSFYDANAEMTFGNDAVSKEIEKKTGVTLDVQQSSGNAREKLNLMLASNDYPDLMLIGRSTGLVNRFIETEALVPLDELIDKFGSNIKEQYGEILSRERYKDGNIYGLPNWYGMDEQPVLGFMIRQDLLAEFASEEVVNGDIPIGQDEFISYLKAFKSKYPQIDGKPTIPMTLWAENWGSLIGSFQGMFGLKSYYEIDGRLMYDFKNPKFKDMLAYINSIYREGLIDREWATNKKQLWEQKLSSGAVFSTVEAYWNTFDVAKILSADNEGATFMPYKVVANGVNPLNTTYSARNPMGWDVVTITKNNKFPEETIKFLDYLASDEGQKLIMSGVEGLHYTVKDGKRVYEEKLVTRMRADYNEVRKEDGIRYWTICVKNGVAKDGQPYHLWDDYNNDPVNLFAKKTLGDTAWDMSPYDGLNPTGGSPDALIYQKINDKSIESYTKMINAVSEQEFNNLWRQFMNEVEDIGAAKIEAVFEKNYNERMQLWGEKH